MLSRICVWAGLGHVLHAMLTLHLGFGKSSSHQCRRGLKGPLGSALNILQKSRTTAEHFIGLFKTTCICQTSFQTAVNSSPTTAPSNGVIRPVLSAFKCLRCPHTTGNADTKWKLLVQTPTMTTADYMTSDSGTLLIEAPRRWTQNGVLISVKVQNNQPGAGVDL